MKFNKISSSDYLIILKKGDLLKSSLIEFFNNVNGDLVSINSGIGMSINNGINQYNITTNKYIKSVITQELEITSLSGNIALDQDNNVIPHVHGVFSNPDGQVFSGHVSDIEILITCEIFVSVYQNTNITRNPSIRNLNLLNH